MKGKQFLRIATVLALAAPVPAAAEEALFVPVISIRTGPMAAVGSAVVGGYTDYLALTNVRDGGVNGVRLVWEECETAYQPDRIIECYERLKNRGAKGATVFHPLSTAATYALMARARQDRIPLVTLGLGRTDATDGRVFPYLFPIMVNYWSQATVKIAYIAEQAGGFARLEGLRIANIHHDSAYGRETRPVLQRLAARHGFDLRHFPIAHPGLDQKATWLQIARSYRPDWVILRGTGVMCPTALKEAARVGFPRERMIGVWWCGSEEDTVPAGRAATGFLATTFNAPGRDFPVIRDILDLVHARGHGNIATERVGSIHYNRGLLMGLITVEAFRAAMAEFGDRALSGAEVQWGLEHLDITAERIRALGADGLLAPLATSCYDHEGRGLVTVQQWDGEAWRRVSDWIEPDWALTRAMIEESAAAYAAEQGITPRDCPAPAAAAR